jgi:hypothetical protein
MEAEAAQKKPKDSQQFIAVRHCRFVAITRRGTLLNTLRGH